MNDPVLVVIALGGSSIRFWATSVTTADDDIAHGCTHWQFHTERGEKLDFTAKWRSPEYTRISNAVAMLLNSR